MLLLLCYQFTTGIAGSCFFIGGGGGGGGLEYVCVYKNDITFCTTKTNNL